MPYYLSCRSCGFEEMVGSVEEVLARQREHLAARDDRHAVTFERFGERPFLRGGVSDAWDGRPPHPRRTDPGR